MKTSATGALTAPNAAYHGDLRVSGAAVFFWLNVVLFYNYGPHKKIFE
jgi:hypothetical protein